MGLMTLCGLSLALDDIVMGCRVLHAGLPPVRQGREELLRTSAGVILKRVMYGQGGWFAGKMASFLFLGPRMHPAIARTRCCALCGFLCAPFCK